MPMMWFLAACGSTVPPEPAEPPEPPVELVEVSHDRELRGVWVATVANIDFPSKPGLDVELQRRELANLVQTMDELGFNTLFFQVRAAADAMYASDLEPWSRALTGREGMDPGYDPLEELLVDAHGRGMEVHAWLNPLRASTTGRGHAEAHVIHSEPGWTVRYGDLVWLDPGQPGPVARLEAVVRDLVRRYDLDGVHFDDYFYPYPVKGKAFPDDATYASHAPDGTDRADWRRSNVDGMVSAVARAVREEDPRVWFGVSPFGIYRPGIPEGIRGFDPVASLYADPLAWHADVDYLAPQLYWPTTREAQAFGKLASWWADQSRPTTRMYTGLYASALGTGAEWTLEELRRQVHTARTLSGLGGQIWFSARPILDDRQGIRALASELYAAPALPPARPGLDDDLPDPPQVGQDASGVRVSGDARAYTVYRPDGPDWVLDRVLGRHPDPVDLAPGRWAIAAVGPYGRESLGVVIEVATTSSPDGGP